MPLADDDDAHSPVRALGSFEEAAAESRPQPVQPPSPPPRVAPPEPPPEPPPPIQEMRIATPEEALAADADSFRSRRGVPPSTKPQQMSPRALRHAAQRRWQQDSSGVWEAEWVRPVTGQEMAIFTFSDEENL